MAPRTLLGGYPSLYKRDLVLATNPAGMIYQTPADIKRWQRIGMGATAPRPHAPRRRELDPQYNRQLSRALARRRHHRSGASNALKYYNWQRGIALTGGGGMLGSPGLSAQWPQ